MSPTKATFCTAVFIVRHLLPQSAYLNSSWSVPFCRNRDHYPAQCYKHDSNRYMSVIIEKSNIPASIVEETERNEAPHSTEQPVKMSKFFTQKLESLSWLHSAAPGFPVSGDKISVIHEPKHFYDVLLEKCRTAKRRITLASLYLGTGRLEEELVSAIGESLQRQGDSLKVKVLLDFTRGSRGKHNSRRMLLPLMRQFEQSCQVFYLFYFKSFKSLFSPAERYYCTYFFFRHRSSTFHIQASCFIHSHFH